MNEITRRRLLSSTLLGGAGFAALVLPRRVARALTVAPMDAEAQRLYLSACSTRDGTYHRQLVAEVRERLKGQATDAQIEAAITQSSCPVCGCPITAS